jgi:uncharacterized protein
MEKIKFYFLWLSLICVVVFGLQNLPGIPGFTETFVLNEKVFDGEIWRLISAVFLHGGGGHLLYNMFALLLFGFILERLIGSKRFLIVFLVSGVVANMIAVNFYDSSLGASGAIYGILGCIIILRPMMMVWAFGIIIPMFVAGLLWIAGDIMGVFGFGDANVGRVAHLGGMGVGLLMGVWWRFGLVGKLGGGGFSKGVGLDKEDEKVEVLEEVGDEWERRWM